MFVPYNNAHGCSTWLTHDNVDSVPEDYAAEGWEVKDRDAVCYR